MPLRKSPRRTRALPAANRRNSRRSTDPRTAAGKRHSTGAQRTKPESYSSQSSSENMSLPANRDRAYAEAHALAERFIGWLMGWRKRTKPESYRNQDGCRNMSPAGDRGGRNPSGSARATGLRRVLQDVKTALTPRKECRQLPLFQTKPEYLRNNMAYKNISKAPGWLGWLGAAASFLLKPGRAAMAESSGKGKVGSRWNTNESSMSIPSRLRRADRLLRSQPPQAP